MELDPPRLHASLPAMTSNRLVVVSPHPDDEVLACGGLIASHAARGGSVAVIAVTDGEASHRGDPRWPSERLGSVRSEERTRGLQRLGLGLDAVTRLRLADGAIDARRDDLYEALSAVLLPEDIVVSTWSLDGHPDHDATGAAVDRACAERGCTLLQAPVWMWHWSAPGDARVPWMRLRSFDIPSDALARKERALAEHVTQLWPRLGSLPPVLGPAILARARRAREYFFV